MFACHWSGYLEFVLWKKFWVFLKAIQANIFHHPHFFHGSTGCRLSSLYSVDRKYSSRWVPEAYYPRLCWSVLASNHAHASLENHTWDSHALQEKYPHLLVLDGSQCLFVDPKQLANVWRSLVVLHYQLNFVGRAHSFCLLCSVGLQTHLGHRDLHD